MVRQKANHLGKAGGSDPKLATLAAPVPTTQGSARFLETTNSPAELRLLYGKIPEFQWMTRSDGPIILEGLPTDWGDSISCLQGIGRMDRGNRRRLLALRALLLMSAIQAVTPDARDLASSALLKLFTLSTQPAHHIFNERDRSEEVCREAQVAPPCESATEADCTPTGLLEIPPSSPPWHDAWRGLAMCGSGLPGSARMRLRSLCRLIC